MLFKFKKKQPTSLELVARAFAYVARIIRDKGRRLERASVQSTWKMIRPGSSWERRDGSTAKMQRPNPHGSRAQRRMKKGVVAVGRRAAMSTAAAVATARASR